MSLKKNILANYLGQGWVALMGIAFIPLYIKYLGLEAYGLVGIYIVLQAWLTLLDVGMTPTLSREMARFTGGAHSSQSIRDLLRSLEIVCIGIALLIVVTLWLVSGWFAQNWFQAGNLPLETIRESIAIMGMVAAMRFVEGLYRGAIVGLQEQVWLNIFSAMFATLRGLGTIVLLAWISPTIQAFFLWQGFISILTVLILAIRVHKTLPDSTRPARFTKNSILNVWDFAKGMVATTLLSLVLTHTDKILLSRLLSLKDFGIYTLATTVANSLMLFVVPLSQSYSPRFTELITRNDQKGLVATYHQGSQLMTVMLIPPALMLILHGETLVTLWSGEVQLAKHTAPLIAILAIGTAFNGLMNLPYMLQLSYGWSTFAAKVNAVLVMIQIPMLFWATQRYGSTGAAWVWVAINASYIFVVINIMHRYLLPNEKWSWYRRDLAYPALAATLISYLGTLIHPAYLTKWGQLAWLILIGTISFLAAIYFSAEIRSNLIALIRRNVLQHLRR